jgi:hypothetical protein
VLVITALLFAFSLPLALLTVAGMPLALLGPRFLGPRAERASYGVRTAEAGIASAVSENISAQPVVRAFGLGPAQVGAFRRQLLADLVPGLPPGLRSDPETERYRLFDAAADVPVVLAAGDLDGRHGAVAPDLDVATGRFGGGRVVPLPGPAQIEGLPIPPCFELAQEPEFYPHRRPSVGRAASVLQRSCKRPSVSSGA